MNTNGLVATFEHSPHGQRRWHLRSLALSAAVALLLCSTSAGASVHPQVAQHSTVLKPDLAFFRGKTITYIVANAPGTPAALVTAAMQPAMEKFLGATINIQYVSGAETIGDDIVGGATPNGLTVGEISVGTALASIFTNTAPLNFPILKIAMIGATHSNPFLVVACQGSPFTSFAQVAQGNSPISVINITSGAVDLLEHFLMAAYEPPHRYLTGYTSASSVPGCQRGDGNLAAQGSSNYVNTSGTATIPGVTPLLLTFPVPKGSPQDFLNNETPSLVTFIKQHPPKTAFGKEAMKLAVPLFAAFSSNFATFAPHGTPPARVLALTDALEAATKDPAVKAAFNQLGFPTGLVPWSVTLGVIRSEIKHQTLITKYMNY